MRIRADNEAAVLNTADIMVLLLLELRVNLNLLYRRRAQPMRVLVDLEDSIPRQNLSVKCSVVVHLRLLREIVRAAEIQKVTRAILILTNGGIERLPALRMLLCSPRHLFSGDIDTNVLAGLD